MWRPSRITGELLADMVARFVIGPQQELLWRAPDGDLPMENKTEALVFASFFEHGFGIPLGSYFRGLLHHYGIEVMQLNPNSILVISFFVHLCESYLGIARYLIYGSGCIILSLTRAARSPM